MFDDACTSPAQRGAGASACQLIFLQNANELTATSPEWHDRQEQFGSPVGQAIDFLSPVVSRSSSTPHLMTASGFLLQDIQQIRREPFPSVQRPADDYPAPVVTPALGV